MTFTIPWWLRLGLQRSVASLPFAIRLWKLYLRRHHLTTIDEETVLSALRQLELVRAHCLPLTGTSILELGSGWKPIIPLIFRMASVERILMTDVSRTMDYAMLEAAIRQVRLKAKAAPSLLPELGLSLDNIPVQLPTDFTTALNALHLEYHIGLNRYPPVDGMISHNVLEHIPEAEIPSLLLRCREALKPGGWMIHFIDHSDHIQHRDPSISPLHFLRFEESAWKRWSIGPFHQNRLRWFEFRDRFTQAGFHILKWEKECYAGLVEEAKRHPLCSRYRAVAPEDIAVLKSRVVLQKE